MTEVLILLAWFAFGFLIGFLLWALWCLCWTGKALRQRLAIIDYIYEERLGREGWDAWFATSFERHHRCLCFLKNPRSIYPPILQPAFDRMK